MSAEIIEVKQLPIIAEKLQSIKEDVTARVENALSLVCTEDTVKAVKKARAELAKEFKAWEEKRREVKKAVMSPYEQFEEVYKDCITEVFNKADDELKSKIDSVESELKEQKRTEVKAYFDEYLQSKNIDFLTFEMANINVTLSASLKSLKEQAKAFVDRVCDDLNLIETQEHKAEILVEYKLSLNVSGAITTVVNRYKAIEEEKQKAAERARKEAEAKEAESKVEEIAPPAEVLAPPQEVDEVLTVAFKVTAPKSKLRELKTFLNNGGYDYE